MTIHRFALLALLSIFYWAAFPAQAQIDFSPVVQQTPPAPTDILAFVRGTNLIVSWKNVKAPAVTEFRVFRFERNAPEATLKVIGVVPHNTATPAVVEYTDTTALPSRAYAYFVTSKDRFSAQSPNSKITSINTSPDFGQVRRR
jgi:hypothetical protein